MRRLHIAFLTPEFPTEVSTAGGLSNYLCRMSRALLETGHDVEVFTLSENREEVLDYDGIRVHRVNRSDDPLVVAAYCKAMRGPLSIAGTRLHARGARALAAALAQREAAAPFDIVQSSNYAIAGLFVPRLPHRTHLVRCSSSNYLWRTADRWRPSLDGWYGDRLERQCLVNADVVYAPSRLVADDYRARFGAKAHVLRPALFLETQPGTLPSIKLPPRYLVFFGRTGLLKGTDVLARALKLAWIEAPDLSMVWAGTDHRDYLARHRRLWGDRAANVTWCGPLQKPELYALIRQAIATVVPSRVDNLPNTVLESLQLGIPVIGSRGASIDEIVVPGVHGSLVPIGDPKALARALVAAWRGKAPFDGGNLPLPPIFEDMNPAVAVRKFLELAGRIAPSPQRKVA